MLYNITTINIERWTANEFSERRITKNQSRTHHRRHTESSKNFNRWGCHFPRYDYNLNLTFHILCLDLGIILLEWFAVIKLKWKSPIFCMRHTECHILSLQVIPKKSEFFRYLRKCSPQIFDSINSQGVAWKSGQFISIGRFGYLPILDFCIENCYVRNHFTFLIRWTHTN